MSNKNAAKTDDLETDPFAVPDAAPDEPLDDGLDEIENVSQMIQRFDVDRRRITLKPKQKTRVPRGYARLRVGVNTHGDKLPSVVAMLTNGNVLPVAIEQRLDKDGRAMTKNIPGKNV